MLYRYIYRYTPEIVTNGRQWFQNLLTFGIWLSLQRRLAHVELPSWPFTILQYISMLCPSLSNTRLYDWILSTSESHVIFTSVFLNFQCEAVSVHVVVLPTAAVLHI